MLQVKQPLLLNGLKLVQILWWKNRAILVDPNDSTNKSVFAAGVSGGLWKTNDITATTPTWTEVAPEMENINISCIAADPTNPQIMYVGTGEFAGTAGFGNGVYKSSDGGANWSLLSYSFPVVVSDLVVRNENGNGVLYVGGGMGYDSQLGQEWSVSTGNSNSGGIYRSTDQGNSFVRVSPALTSTYHFNVNNFDIDSNGRIWVGTIEINGVVWKVTMVEFITVMMVPHGLMLIGSLLVAQLREQL